MSTTIVWCLLVDYWKKPVGNIFEVQADNVLHLTQKVKNYFDDNEDPLPVPASNLVVWQSKEPKLLADDDLDERVSRLDFSDKAKISKLSFSKKVINLGLSEDEVLLVQVPPIVSCLVVDYWNKPVGNVFEVQAALSDNVSHLTQKVKEKKNFASPADDLVVWQCKEPKLLIDDDLEERASSLDFSDKTKISRLPTSKRVVDLGLSEDEILLVRLPPIVSCLVVDYWNKHVGNVFEVQAALSDNVSHLTQKVKEKKNFASPADDLVVWQCKEPKLLIDDDLEERASNLDFSDKTKISRLSISKRVVDLDLSENEVLLVQLLPIPNNKRTYDEATGQNYRSAPTASVKRIKFIQDQEQNAEEARNALPPSQAGKVTNLPSHQKKAPVFNGRPIDRTGPPIGLYHPVFNEFERGLVSDDPIPLKIRLVVEKFINVSADIYSEEKYRLNNIKRILNEIFGNLLDVTEGGARSDGTIVVTCGAGTAFVLILELKNEIGTGGMDPFIQSSLVYQKYYSVEERSIFRHKSCCPSILVGIAGPWLCVGGAVYVETPVAQPLTDYVSTGNPRTKAYLGRVFHCIKAAILSLQSYYTQSFPRRSLDSGQKEDELEGPCGFPYISNYNGTAFSYVEKLSGSNNLVFKIREGNTFRVIKFTSEYNEAAHKLLAATNKEECFAPALHYVSPAIYGGLKMVVMDYLDGKMAHETRLSDAHFNQLQSALSCLHSKGFVFGDLREPNIMVSGDRVMLIDFDWCGEDGKATYPSDLNDSTVQWANGISPGLEMKKEHDRDMLEILRRRHNL